MNQPTRKEQDITIAAIAISALSLITPTTMILLSYIALQALGTLESLDKRFQAFEVRVASEQGQNQVRGAQIDYILNDHEQRIRGVEQKLNKEK